ncbi:anthocyanidin 5,3-O-glucosyltransferase-like [Ananas comosus]|uniref:Glycosyltransferase n=1 Tax=Ananas comosus TaxID=4615 RepID=A0A199VK42_ANACO|nr:anthocyanidin 5,3-O-glucosyltransferase-like [Ananas comosus]OAY77464.1 Phloretin 2'-O-glucosyltransferase [Ananas comosus]
MKETVVLYPGMGVGHLTPMVELAKLFVRRGFASVAVVAVESPFPGAPSMEPVISRLSSSHPASSISFHLLPRVAYTPPPPGGNPFAGMFDVLRLNNPALLSLVRSLSPPPRALVLDFFCTDALDVAAELALPAYFFFSSGAANLAVFLHLPHDPAGAASFKDLGRAPVHFPGVRPIPACDMPQVLSDRDTDTYRALVRNFGRLPNSRGILVNTFEALEPGPARALRDGLPLPGRPMPPTYCVGPLVTGGLEKAKRGGGVGGEGDGRPEAERHACLAWLDARPERSVVFLCFGSMGAFSADQLRETALGLERSGHGFLWVVRSPPDPDPSKAFAPRPEPDLGALLPEGFLDRTAGRGLVVPSWAPQVEVLRHGAVGAFVSHCGWNSSLEAITAGVPLVCWPLYAEQRMNKVFLVDEIRVGVAVDGYDQALVAADEVERKVRLVMETDDGERLRARAAELKDKAAAALDEGGSSHAAFQEFLKDLAKQEENAV